MASYELPVMGRLLEVSEVAEVTSLTEKTVRAWAQSGRIGSVKLGRSLRIPESELRALVIRGVRPKRKD
jgi:excisionase family DNA binding protein